MDNLTHTAVGLFLSRAGLNRWSPLATPILLLASNAPDIDVVTAAGGSLNYLHYHRHLTHSLIAVPFMALLPVLLVKLFARQPVRLAGAWAASLVAVLSHLLLDLTNTYGIRLLLPFSERWLRLDITYVFDLWIWGVFFLAIAAPFVSRLVGSEIASGAREHFAHGRRSAWIALGFLLFYDCGRAVLHTRAVATVDSRLYQGATPQRALALPTPGDPWHWEAVVETQDFYAVQPLDLRADFDPTRASIFHKPETEPAIDAARSTPVFARFFEWSQFPLLRVSPAPEPEGARLVEVFDMRFGTPAAPGFMASAVVAAGNRVVDAEFRFARPRQK